MLALTEIKRILTVVVVVHIDSHPQRVLVTTEELRLDEESNIDLLVITVFKEKSDHT